MIAMSGEGGGGAEKWQSKVILLFPVMDNTAEP